MPANKQGQMVGKLPPAPSGADVKGRLNKMARTKKFLAGREKIRVRCMEDEIVIYDGYPIQIKGKEWVHLPDVVVEILEQSERI